MPVEAGQAGGHGSHHVGVDDGDLRGVVGVDAHELADLLGVGDDVVDGYLGSGTGGRRHGDGEHSVVLSRSNALEAADIGELGVVDDDADTLAVSMEEPPPMVTIASASAALKASTPSLRSGWWGWA